MMRAIQQMTEDMRNKVRLMVGRAIIALVNDTGAVQTAQVQLLADEVQDDAERIQQYGLTSKPHAGAEAVVVFAGGNRDHGLIIAVEDRRYRLTGLEDGEVALYDDLGQKFHMRRNGIVIDGAGLPVTIQNAPTVRMDTALLEVTGNIKDNCDAPAGKTMAQMRGTYNGHTHPNPEGGNVGTPNQAM